MVSVPVSVVLKTLKKMYPDAGCTLDWDTPLGLLVATILSAQCTDKRVNIVTKTLFKKYKTPQDYLNVTQAELERDIHSCGTFRMKALAIRETCKTLLKDFGGQVPRTMAEMLTLRGVGRKTASVVLSTVYGIEEGIAVDTHVTRIAKLLGLTRHTAQAKIERDLMKKTPRAEWSNLSHLLIAHGRATNAARNPDLALLPFLAYAKPKKKR
ncbi:MAG TPA: endonuclease III [Candidatus Peribacteria bacterium]|nr:endonuclease III [Candidatus Peribacteria bacterium]